MYRPRLSLDDFKKWMEQHQNNDHLEKPKRNGDILGTQIESKVSTKKLISKMTSEEGEDEEVAIDFMENGGTIIDVAGKEFLVEVGSGSFYILRHYVTKM